MISRSGTLAVLVSSVALAAPAVAGAHISVRPPTAAAGAEVVETIRVPNERDDKATTKVQVQLPDGFASAGVEPVTGWKATVERARFATPVQTEDGEVTEGVKQITWTARSGGGIEPGESADFPISVRIPGEAGDKLTFKALQTYEGGEVVRWIGAPDADKPAAVLEVTAASATAAPAVVEDDDDDSDGLAVIALIVGGLGLAAGGLALINSRRKEST